MIKEADWYVGPFDLFVYEPSSKIWSRPGSFLGLGLAEDEARAEYQVRAQRGEYCRVVPVAYRTAQIMELEALAVAMGARDGERWNAVLRDEDPMVVAVLLLTTDDSDEEIIVLVDRCTGEVVTAYEQARFEAFWKEDWVREVAVLDMFEGPRELQIAGAKTLVGLGESDTLRALLLNRGTDLAPSVQSAIQRALANA